ncbi:MAG TPA: cytochrome P460 family protein [Kofleriaceae bacterium]
MRALLLIALVACGSSNGTPDFPADYATTYMEVRDCRPSIDHDGENVRVMASPTALAPYTNRTDPFPDGAIIVKEQYARTDSTCSGAIQDYSVMMRVENGDAPLLPQWDWQHVDANRGVISEDIKRCTSCHADCAHQGVGYAGTCEEP